MSRVLITGGAGELGAAVARLLLSDPDYDVRISDPRPAPQWMREGCEIHRGDLAAAPQAAAATKGCSHVIHLMGFGLDAGGDAPHTLLEHEAALHGAVLGAALERGVERFVYVSSPLVFERAELFPTPEEHLEECLTPRSARGFAALSGERRCAAARQEHGLQYAICRPFGAYGGLAGPPAADPPDGEPLAPAALELDGLIARAGRGERPLAVLGSAERTLTPTHVDDLARGVFAALASPAAVGEDFNLAAEHELSLQKIAQIAWQAGAAGAGSARAAKLSLQSVPAREPEASRSCPSVLKARELLGWEAQVDAIAGIGAAAAAARERAEQPVVAAAGRD
jgi:UDP-glucose 4-epimerase